MPSRARHQLLNSLMKTTHRYIPYSSILNLNHRQPEIASFTASQPPFRQRSPSGAEKKSSSPIMPFFRRPTTPFTALLAFRHRLEWLALEPQLIDSRWSLEHGISIVARDHRDRNREEGKKQDEKALDGGRKGPGRSGWKDDMEKWTDGSKMKAERWER